MFCRFFNLSQHKVRTVNAEITTIPFRKQKQKKIANECIHEYWPQNKCSHIECLAIEKQNNFESSLFNTRRQFKKLNYEAKLNFIAGFIQWPDPKRKLTVDKWLDAGASNKCNYPQNRKFMIPGFGFGAYYVCFDYLKYFLCIGKEALRKYIKLIWECRSKGLLYYKHISKYAGYCNTKLKVQRWILDAIEFILENISCSKEHYVSRKTGMVYLELTNGERMTLSKAWRLYIEKKQPRSYEHYVLNSGAEVDDVKKPFPSEKHWVTTLSAKLLIQSERFHQDECNACGLLKTLKLETVDEEKKAEIQLALDSHEVRWKFMFSLNAFVNAECIKCWRTFNIHFQFDRQFMQFPEMSVHIMVDYGLDRPELITSHNMCYFKRKIGVKHFPAIYNNKPFVFVWSAMHGGKAVEETRKCIDFLLSQRCTGAGRMFITMDGALISYDILKYFAWCVHPKNKNRRLRALHLISLETGHSFIPADTLDYRVERLYKKRNKWSKCSERVEFVNENSDIEMIQFVEFEKLPSFFDTIFKTKWLDDCDTPNPANIRDDKPLIYEFGMSEEYSENELNVVEHYGEMWMRISEDWKVPCRKIKLFKNKFAEMKSSEFDDIPVVLKPAPKIKANTLQDVRSVLQFFVNKDELFQYYQPKNIVAPTAAEKKKSESETEVTTPSHAFIKLTRRMQMIKIMQGDKEVKLTKYERKNSKNNATTSEIENCKEQIKWKIDDVNVGNKKLRVATLKAELKIHKIKPLPTKKIEMIKSLRKHYDEFHKEQLPVLQLPQFDIGTANNSNSNSNVSNFQPRVPPPLPQFDIETANNSNSNSNVNNFQPRVPPPLPQVPVMPNNFNISVSNSVYSTFIPMQSQPIITCANCNAPSVRYCCARNCTIRLCILHAFCSFHCNFQ